ncbi:ornithine decarboxylase [Steroidobacter agaridevorans]|uniref:Ornithine decarboxylase n=1 Tax=Steroidobacter agaridevorans TaxID=2695856 RepID=A0A829YIG8_9GAMM|nr:type III PLP-dependent enzyme [Steroidobacter agaridevorans]GFE83097.1 ornithine decarboxylase [Steroidobacter agaridevorans]GFE86179.1 ornithine decarboxylase [Steroidobacter agaridevorans]
MLPRAAKQSLAVSPAHSFDSTTLTETEIRALVARFGSPLLVVDCEQVRRQYRALKAALPGVDLHYALKPLPHAAVVSCLRDEGAYFDLATTGEVELVKQQGIAPSRCIHTHPIKRDSDIRDALRYGVTTFVADNPDELKKFVRYRKRAELLIRVSFRSPNAVVDLSKKFGCAPGDVLGLIEQARRLGVRVKGLSFHVGSQATDPAKYVEAVQACTNIMAEAVLAGLPSLDVLDIGGGYPVAYNDEVTPIDEFCRPIRAALAKLPPHVRVIAEPGRFIAAPAAIAVSSVMGKAKRDGRWWYYLDDGLYGSYSGQMFDHAKYPVSVLREGGELFESVLSGPTCDSIDVIDECIMLPELEMGDLVVGRMMGAYTWASATDFNFFKRAKVVVMNETADARRVVRLQRKAAGGRGRAA